jgi:hypothetical protein
VVPCNHTVDISRRFQKQLLYPVAVICCCRYCCVENATKTRPPDCSFAFDVVVAGSESNIVRRVCSFYVKTVLKVVKYKWVFGLSSIELKANHTVFNL